MIPYLIKIQRLFTGVLKKSYEKSAIPCLDREGGVGHKNPSLTVGARHFINLKTHVSCYAYLPSLTLKARHFTNLKTHVSCYAYLPSLTLRARRFINCLNVVFITSSWYGLPFFDIY